MASLKSPRPTPKFFMEAQTFSTKKEKSTPREQPPPRPPVKSAPPISRVFRNRLPSQKAQAVSFRASENFMLSKHYNESSKELYFDQCFEIDHKLGVGSFGEVFKVKSKEDGRYYAVKRSRDRFRGESDRRRKLEEVAKHEQLPKHPNCIRFIKAWEEKQHLYIQTELCETSLSNLAEQNHDIPETLIWNYLVDLLLAVKHLHDHDLIHMDIKPANIFVSKDGICKLGDFGLVLDLTKGDLSEAQEGDPKYLAPELMEGKFTKAADVFSLGISILELACDLDLPRGGDSWHQLRQCQLPAGLTDRLSDELKEFIQKMLTPDYRKRPSASELLHCPVIQKVFKKRKRDLWLKSIVNRCQDVFYSAVSLLYSIWLFFSIKANRLIGSKTIEPCPRQHPLEWDFSFSDDECFEDEMSSLLHSSLAAPLHDSSTSSESRNGSFILPHGTERLVNSTPANARHRAVERLNTPHQMMGLDWDSYRISPSNSPSIGSHSTSLNTSFTHSAVDEELVKLNIGPKNLMDVFEAASSDED